MTPAARQAIAHIANVIQQLPQEALDRSDHPDGGAWVDPEIGCPFPQPVVQRARIGREGEGRNKVPYRL